jgi:GNAT superfamily N-acetyltransferase
MSIEYSFDASRIDVDQVWRLLRETYWSPDVRRDVVERAIAHSIVIGAFDADSGGLVGFARAVTDRATFAWLCDVIVVEAWRGRGIATRMVRALIDHPELLTLRRWCLATKDAHRVYAPIGFAPVPSDRWMELKLDPSAWAQKEDRV